MPERANTDTDSERVPERVLCPNCPADFPRPFSSREVRCRRCETTFVAPDAARAAAAIDDGWIDRIDTERSDRTARLDHDTRTAERSGRTALVASAVGALESHLSTIALCLNLVTALLWLAGLLPFEVTVVAMLLLTSTLVADGR